MTPDAEAPSFYHVVLLAAIVLIGFALLLPIPIPLLPLVLVPPRARAGADGGERASHCGTGSATWYRP